MLNVLSVDWDYFFPDPFWYDWGHKEDPIFLEFLWQMRATNRNLKTRVWAVDEMRVDRKRRHNFWKKVCPDSHIAVLYVTESHKEMYDLLKAFEFAKVSVWNFDAHHDLSYQNRVSRECDNWAWFAMQEGLMKEYHVIYPEWRLEGRKNGEGGFPIDPTSVHYEIPAELPSFDLVYICRSSAWTPSWADDAWLRFVGHWRKANGEAWRNRRTVPFVQKKRYPNLQEAKRLRDQHMTKFLEQIYDKKECVSCQ
jgi:hypothetical protein